MTPQRRDKAIFGAIELAFAKTLGSSISKKMPRPFGVTEITFEWLEKSYDDGIRKEILTVVPASSENVSFTKNKHGFPVKYIVVIFAAISQLSIVYFAIQLK